MTRYKIERITHAVAYITAENDLDAEEIADGMDDAEFQRLTRDHIIYEECE